MPTYDYKCDACGYAFERFHSITAPPIKRCPECGKAKVKRLLGTGAGLIFKGSGFYITDYRDKSYAESAKKDAGEGSASTDSKSATADSKPAAAKEASSSTGATQSTSSKES